MASCEIELELNMVSPSISNSVAPKPPVPPARKRQRLHGADYERIVEYIENPANFQALQGRKTKIGGRFQSKTVAFSEMAAKLSGENGFPEVTGPILQKKYERYVERYTDAYKKAQEFMSGKGTGLSEAKIESGLMLEEKLNSKCPFFFRMHALFGNRSSVDPPAVLTLGMPDEEEEVVGLDSPAKTHRKPESPGSLAMLFAGGESFGESSLLQDQGSIAVLFQESMRQKSEYRHACLEAKEKYREAILEEKRKSREIYQKEEARKAKIDRRTRLMLELFRAGKSTEEIKVMLEMLTEFESAVDSSL